MFDPSYPERRSAGAADADRELVSVLRAMLDENETITVRAAVRRMTQVGQPTAVTRDEWRMRQVTAWQAKQQRAREMSGRWAKSSNEKLNVRAEVDQAKMDALQAENAILRAGLVALLRSVGEQGAIKRWRKFFDGYEETFDRLKAMGADAGATVIPIGTARPALPSRGDG
jgi:hypothetical protein